MLLQSRLLSRREYSGTYTPDELRQYFEDVGFYMDDQDWRDYGLGFTSEVLDFDSSLSSAEYQAGLRATEEETLRPI